MPPKKLNQQSAKIFIIYVPGDSKIILFNKLLYLLPLLFKLLIEMSSYRELYKASFTRLTIDLRAEFLDK